MNRTFSLNNVSEIGKGLLAGSVCNGESDDQVQHIQTQIQTTMTNANQNIVLPLTQASLAMAAYSNGFPQSSRSAINSSNHDDSIMRMTLMNNANKFNSKYASSNYLNDYSNRSNLSNSGIMSQPQPQHTRTTPRRRTPRNAEEFLKASGVVDTDTFLNKGYYVGSMFNLNEICKNPNQMSQQQSELHHTNVNLINEIWFFFKKVFF